MDLAAGGTWLAVDPAQRRISCVLNGRGQPGPKAGRRSRGELPLAGIDASRQDRLELYSPFHLLTTGLGDGVELCSWDGSRLGKTRLRAGLTVIANTGLDPDHPRIDWLAPLLDAVSRPEPGHGDSPAHAWASWLRVLAKQEVAPDDPQAIIRRRVLPGGAAHGSSSVSLVAVSRSHIRYDFITVHEPPLPLVDLVNVQLRALS